MRRAVLLLLAVAAVATVFAGWRLLRVAQRLEAVRKDLDATETLVRNGDLDAAAARLDRARADILIANRDVHSAPELALIGWLPVARQNLAALRTSVETALTLVNGGSNILSAARPLADAGGQVLVPLRAGTIPVKTIAEVQRRVGELAASLPGEASMTRSPMLVGPVKQLQRRVFDESTRRKAQFTSVGAGLDLLVEMSGGNGPRRYLIAIANAAEMRGTGGMILSYGVLTSAAGQFKLERVGPIDELLIRTPVAFADRPPDYITRQAAFQPSLLWRNTNLAADFTAVAPVMERMFAAATGSEADGVLQIDSDGLAAILRGVGPVEAPALGTVTADNAVALTLNEAYVQFPDRAERQDVLADVARAAFTRLVSGDYPTVRPLADALATSAAGRHILFHATKASANESALHLGIDGGLPEADSDFAALTVQNLAGNKLDYYLDTSLTVSGRRDDGAPGVVRATIEIKNTAPLVGSPPYIFGPFQPVVPTEGPPFRVGEYRGLVSVYLPAGTRLAAHSGGPYLGPPVAGSEGGRTVVTFGLSVDAGARRVIDLDLELPSRTLDGYQWQFVPTPRVRPTKVLLDLELGDQRIRADGDLRRTVTARASG